MKGTAREKVQLIAFLLSLRSYSFGKSMRVWHRKLICSSSGRFRSVSLLVQLIIHEYVV
jgi:hypothetical protein